MTALETIDLGDLWETMPVVTTWEGILEKRTRFYRRLGRRVNMTVTLLRDRVLFCEGCEGPHLVNDVRSVRGGGWVCLDCRNHGEWFLCGECGLWEDNGSRNGTEDGSVCDYCAEGNYFYCDQCELWYRNDSGHGHDADDGCCESPQLIFAVRFGDTMVSNDSKFTVSLDDGVINREGKRQIRAALKRWSALAPLDDDGSATIRNTIYSASEYVGRDNIGWEWKGTQGNFTTRLKRWLYNTYKLRIPPDTLTEIGNIAAQHRTGGDFTVAFTRDLNLRAGEFFHGGSCWWSDYNYSRCTLKSNGGFAIRSFDGAQVTGRAWVVPLKRDPDLTIDHNWSLVPTFDTVDPYGFVVFNGYGRLEGTVAPSIMAAVTGMEFRQIPFGMDRAYVNSESGYLLSNNPVPASLNIQGSDHSDLFNIEEEARTQSTLPVADNEREQSYVAAF